MDSTESGGGGQQNVNSHGDRLRLAPPSAKCDLGIVQGALRFTAKEESPDEGLLREYSLATITGHMQFPKKRGARNCYEQ